MKNPPAPYKGSDPAHQAFSQSADSTLLAKKQNNTIHGYAGGGEVDYDPESSDYDMQTALSSGLQPDETGHWPSRVPEGPNEGLLLKGRGHETWSKTEEGEKAAGYEIGKRGNRYYSEPEK